MSSDRHTLVERSILLATGTFRRAPVETNQQYLARLLIALGGLPDEAFNGLPAATRTWYMSAVSAFNARPRRPLPNLDGTEDADAPPPEALEVLFEPPPSSPVLGAFFRRGQAFRAAVHFAVMDYATLGRPINVEHVFAATTRRGFVCAHAAVREACELVEGVFDAAATLGLLLTNRAPV